jgi:hypothetical protein
MARRGRPQRTDYDQALKRLITRAPDGFLALVAPGLAWHAERSTELPAVARHADLAWEVGWPDGRRGILHIELQLKVEAEIGERLAEYTLRFWRRDHLPVRSVVVFLREARAIPAAPFVIPWGPEESLRCAYGIVRLWEIPQERVLSTPQYPLWPLAGLMAGVTAGSTLTLAERLVGAPLPEEERRDLTGLLLALAGTRLAPADLLEALRRNPVLEELLKDNGVVQDLVAEGERRGLAEGERRGEQEMVRVMLQGRFGPLSDDVLAALRAADAATLRALAAHVATDTIDQMRARLGLA